MLPDKERLDVDEHPLKVDTPYVQARTDIARAAIAMGLFFSCHILSDWNYRKAYPFPLLIQIDQ